MLDEYLVPLVASALLAGLGYLGKLIATKIKQHTVRDFFYGLQSAAENAVTAVEQTYVSEIRKSREDGTLTTEERMRAKDAAVLALKQSLGKSGKDFLKKLVGRDLEDVLENQVESALGQLKDQKKIFSA